MYHDIDAQAHADTFDHQFRDHADPCDDATTAVPLLQSVGWRILASNYRNNTPVHLNVVHAAGVEEQGAL